MSQRDAPPPGAPTACDGILAAIDPDGSSAVALQHEALRAFADAHADTVSLSQAHGAETKALLCARLAALLARHVPVVVAADDSLGDCESAAGVAGFASPAESAGVAGAALACARIALRERGSAVDNRDPPSDCLRSPEVCGLYLRVAALHPPKPADLQALQRWRALTADAAACLVNAMHGDAAATDTFASNVTGADGATALDVVLRILSTGQGEPLALCRVAMLCAAQSQRVASSALLRDGIPSLCAVAERVMQQQTHSMSDSGADAEANESTDFSHSIATLNESLKALYAIGNMPDSEAHETRDRLGKLVEAVLISDQDEPGTSAVVSGINDDTRINAVQLLMHSWLDTLVFARTETAMSTTPAATQPLHTLRCIVQLLERRLQCLTGAEAGTSNAPHNVLVVCMVLHRLCSISQDLRRATKSIVFPAEVDNMIVLHRQECECAIAALLEEADASMRKGVADNVARQERERRMHPERGYMTKADFKKTLRGQLIAQMTSLNTDLKRVSAELLFLLCDSAQEEFTRRCGFGSAVALLKMKGLIA